MGAHLINGEFQSDKYPTTPRGKVPLSVKDPTAQSLLWEYADRHQSVDAEFSTDLRAALLAAGYHPAEETEVERLRAALHAIRARAADSNSASSSVTVAAIETLADAALNGF